MNLSDAYKILGLDDGASKEDAKNAFRTLAKKYHPDINKDDPDAEKKFKEINEAFQVIQNPKQEANSNFDFGDLDFGGGGFNPFDFIREQFVPTLEPVETNVSLSFIESVLGANKTIKFNCLEGCKKCNASGKIIDEKTKCKICNGSGFVTQQNGGIIFRTSCYSCNGQGSSLIKCDVCNGTKGKYIEKLINFSVPGGILNSQKIRLSGAGSYIEGSNFAAPVFVTANVEKDDVMSIQDMDVISSVDVSLLEALKGCTKAVKTVKGSLNLKIKPLIKNADKIIARGLGVNGVGDHVFTVNINYPTDVSELIKTLEKE